MNKPYLMAVAAMLAATPFAFAHMDGGVYGTPKTYCEDSWFFMDQNTHDYGLNPPWSADGSIAPLYRLASDGCHYADLFADQWDGHLEYGLGGAWLLACERFCGDGTGDGSLVCWTTYADHPMFPTVWVFDHVLSTLGVDVQFGVYVDYLDNVPDPTGVEPNCGDYEVEFGGDCVNHCNVPFYTGLDGSYQVYVFGTVGHVWTG